MELWVVDKDTRRKLDLIRTYTYAQYVDEFVGEGSFTLNVPFSDEATPYLVFGNYIIFDYDALGVIKNVEDSQEEMDEFVVTGKLSNHILGYRSIPFTERYSGSITFIARTLVERHFINPEDIRRKMDFIRLSSEDKYIPEAEETALCETGEPIRGVISSLLLPYKYGFELFPVFTDIDEEAGITSNIQYFDFRVLKPTDRTIDNKDGNEPIVFAFQFNNVSRLDLVDEGESYANVAMVAGEGVGISRKLIESGDKAASGIDRIELYVDARDIQSGEDMTPALLVKAMEQRGLEALQEHLMFTTFDAGLLIEEESVYQYGKHFTKGDIISVIDEKTGKFYDLQIAAVTRTVSDGVEHFDLTFGLDSVTMDSITGSGSAGGSGGGWDYGGSGGGQTETEKIVSWTKEQDGDYRFILSQEEKDVWVSNNKGIDSSIAVSDFVIEVPYNGTNVTVPWEVSSESYDRFTMTIDGENIAGPISGQNKGVASFKLDSGRHTLVAIYNKDASDSGYNDEAKIKLSDVTSYPQHTTVEVKVESTITGEEGTAAYVENVGDDVNVRLKFTIPRGQRGLQGETGNDGLNAYQIAVNAGFEGTYLEWLDSLKGEPGQNGLNGQDGINGKDGADGKSAYELAVQEGFKGTLQEWLESLKGETGDIQNHEILDTEQKIRENTEPGKLIDALVLKDIYEQGIGGGNITVLDYSSSLEYLNGDSQEDPSGGEIVATTVLSYDDTLTFLNEE